MIDVKKTRRVVTGFDENGKSIVAIDGPPGAILGANGAGLGEVWVTDGIADNSLKGDLAKRPITLEPPAGGSVCRFFALDPEDPKLSPKELEERVAAAFKAIGGEHCRPDTERGPGMHTTRNRTPGGELYRAVSGGEVRGKSEGAGSLRIVAAQAAVK